jgi:hypothetical protein
MRGPKISRSHLSSAQTGWSGIPKCFVMRDHPVRSIKGGFAASLLMSRPPLLFEEGSWATGPQARGPGEIEPNTVGATDSQDPVAAPRLNKDAAVAAPFLVIRTCAAAGAS